MRWSAFVVAGLLAAGLALPAQAADFDQAARQVRQDLKQAKAEQVQTEEQVAHEKAGMTQRLALLQKQLATEKQRLATARRRLAETSRKKAELSAELAETGSDLKELAGHVRAAARELLSLAEQSPATAEDPSKLRGLRRYLDKTRFPGLSDISRLIELHFDEMQAGGQAKRRQARLVDRQGREVDADVVRLGLFTTLYKNGDEIGFAMLGPSSGRLLALSGEPDWSSRGSLAEYFEGGAGSVPLDISGGAALRQLSRGESLWEQFLAGGPLVWPIALVGLAALILIIERLIFMQRVRSNTDQMMVKVNQLVADGQFAEALKVVEKQHGRPTANVIEAGLALRGQPSEVIENGLGEAMLRELPRLERFITALKVLAAVAPLLGLLGTVTGMINTFQVITVFGSGDPRLMAGGISEALITTQLGLAVAIPILVVAALLGRKAQRLASDMEEKAVSLSAALIKAGG